MQLSSVFAVGLLSLVIGQDLLSPYNLPHCGIECIKSTLADHPGFACPQSDVDCLCTHPRFETHLRGCFTTCCPDEKDRQAAWEFAGRACMEVLIRVQKRQIYNGSSTFVDESTNFDVAAASTTVETFLNPSTFIAQTTDSAAASTGGQTAAASSTGGASAGSASTTPADSTSTTATTPLPSGPSMQTHSNPLATTTSSTSLQGLPSQGLPSQGLPSQGLPSQGLSSQIIAAIAVPSSLLVIVAIGVIGVLLWRHYKRTEWERWEWKQRRQSADGIELEASDRGQTAKYTNDSHRARPV